MKKKSPQSPCVVCNENEWVEIVFPFDRIPTTSGTFIKGPVSKFQCRICGVLTSAAMADDARTKHYTSEYSRYYKRPGAELADRERYRQFAEVVLSQMQHRPQTSVLDIGCGNGTFLGVLRDLNPHLNLFGVEPSDENAEHARQTTGAKIENGFFPVNSKVIEEQTFDLIVSINVFQHIDDPLSFLSSAKRRLADSGILALVMPDSSFPSSELIWADHKWSFCSDHVRKMIEDSGLTLLGVESFDRIGMTDKIAVICQHADSALEPSSYQFDFANTLLDQRLEYVRNWQRIERRLSAAAESCDGRLYNFGASMWSISLAAFCNQYWDSVAACLVDNAEGHVLGKDVIDIGQVELGPGDKIVLGVHPRSQAKVYERLLGEGMDVIRWDDLVDC